MWSVLMFSNIPFHFYFNKICHLDIFWIKFCKTWQLAGVRFVIFDWQKFIVTSSFIILSVLYRFLSNNATKNQFRFDFEKNKIYFTVLSVVVVVVFASDTWMMASKGLSINWIWQHTHTYYIQTKKLSTLEKVSFFRVIQISGQYIRFRNKKSIWKFHFNYF